MCSVGEVEEAAIVAAQENDGVVVDLQFLEKAKTSPICRSSIAIIAAYIRESRAILGSMAGQGASLYCFQAGSSSGIPQRPWGGVQAR